VLEPIYRDDLSRALEQLVQEHVLEDKLAAANLVPSRSVLFTGAPGTGKTLAARWIAWRLGLPLLVLDLSTVMSSYLGKTGGNIRSVFDHAKRSPCVLLLDEFDAVAKRRDDESEAGELKRLVTVLLQEFDEWPSHSLLVAATNHAELLDPAIWRRFDVLIDFPLPTRGHLASAIRSLTQVDNLDDPTVNAITYVFEGKSIDELQRWLAGVRRGAVLAGVAADEAIWNRLTEQVSRLTRKQRLDFALAMLDHGMSQRRAHEVTGVSRDTIRQAQYERS
jgi:SpoVK/Ycf46/Vps4 family AAA+-type ATPase